MTKFGLAQSVRRVEDPRLLKGGGRYTDDIVLPGMLHGIVLRSPHAAAKLGAIDTKAAASVPGVKAIYTAADSERRRHHGDALRGAGAEPRRVGHGKPATLGARRWRGAPCRRSGGVHRCRNAEGGARRRGTDLGRLHHRARRHGCRPGDQSGCTPGVARCGEQRRVRLGHRRQGGHRCAVRHGRARHAADRREQPRHRRIDGGARLRSATSTPPPVAGRCTPTRRAAG